MSTPTPAAPTQAAAPTTPATVVDDVHQVLDTAKQDATATLAAVELHFGDLAGEAKQLVHDTVELLKQKLADLFGHGQAQAPEQATPPA